MKRNNTPIVDLSGLSLTNQTLEYFDRRKEAKLNPDRAVLVKFLLQRIARDVVDSIINDRDTFFITT